MAEERMNENVRIALITSGVVGVADSVWNGTVLASYCYDLGHSNTFVGLVEAASGLVQLFVAIPVGAYADGRDARGVTRKVKMTRLACPFTMVSAAATAAVTWGVTFDGTTSSLRWMLIVVMMLWGFTEAVVMGPFQAMFADSLPTGDRSKYYSFLYSAYIGASAAGPAVSIALFALWGDTWSPRQLAKVLLSGMALEAVSSPLFLLFREKYLLGAEADAVDETDSSAKRDDNFVPVTLFVASLLSSLGSGMTVKFFPLFFRETVGLSPIKVQLVYAVVPLAMVAGMAAAQSVHPVLGRVQTLCLFKLAAVALLVAMIQLVHSAPIAVVVVYVVRTALANCTYPIEESILMDFVPRDRRARWKSLESVSSFGWCGSALVGGLVADRYSYSTTFAVTACLQFLAALLSSTLALVVPRKEEQLRRPAHQPDDYVRLEDDLPDQDPRQEPPPQEPPQQEEDTTLDFDQPLLSRASECPSTTSSASNAHPRVALSTAFNKAAAVVHDSAAGIASDTAPGEDASTSFLPHDQP